MSTCQNLPLPQLIATLFERTLARLMDFLEQTEFGDLRATHFLNVFLHLRIDGKRSGELARLAGMTPQSMGELVDYLEQRGYVKRIPDPTDRRAKLVVYDERGFEASQNLELFYAELEQEWIDRIGPEYDSVFRASLVTLVSGGSGESSASE